MRILGIDPGFAIVGFGVLDYNGMDFRPLEYGAITTEANTPFTQRLTAIYQDLNFILDRFQPDCVSVERLFLPPTKKQSSM